MDKKRAEQIAIESVGGDRKIEILEEHNDAYVFMCESRDPEMTPSKIAVAVNKSSGKVGCSILSVEQAVASCK